MTDANSPAYEAHFVRTPFQLLSGSKWKKLVAFRVDGEGVLLGGCPYLFRQGAGRLIGDVSGGLGEGLRFEERAVAEHGEQDIDAAAGETHQGLLMPLALGLLPLVVGPGGRVGQ